MSEKHFYEVSVQWNAEKKGTMSSPGLSPVEVATPPEFPGGHPGIWSPEHLFVGAVNSCFMTTFLAIAANSKLDYADFQSRAIGTLESVEGKLAISEIVIEAVTRIQDEAQRQKALKVMEKSEKACLISNSVKTIVHLKPTVEVVEKG